MAVYSCLSEHQFVWSCAMAVNNDSSGVVRVENDLQQLTLEANCQRATLADCKSRFAGEADEDVNSFVSRVEHNMNMFGITDEEALKQLPLLLDGAAAEWWRCFRRHIHSWDETKSEILHHFGQSKSIVTFFEQPRRRRRVDPPLRKHGKSTSSSSSRPVVYIYDDDDWPWDLTKCPRRFSGAEDEDVDDFIEDLELFIAVKGIPLDKAFLQLRLIFKGCAKMWWRSIRPRSIKTWEEAMTELRQRFGYTGGHIKFGRLDLSELLQRRQQPHERAIDYIISISSTMRKMKFPDSDQVCFIMEGLRPSIARHIIGKDKLSPLQLTSEIIRIEKCLIQLSNRKRYL